MARSGSNTSALALLAPSIAPSGSAADGALPLRGDAAESGSANAGDAGAAAAAAYAAAADAGAAACRVSFGCSG